MNYSKFFRTTLMSLVTVFAFGFGLMSCDKDEKENQDELLIVGTWTINTHESYLNDTLYKKVNFETHLIESYRDGKVIKTDTIDADILYTDYVFNKDKTCVVTQHNGLEDDVTESYTYSIEKVDGKSQLKIIEEDGTVTEYVIEKLTEEEFSFAYYDSEYDEGYVFKYLWNLKKN